MTDFTSTVFEIVEFDDENDTSIVLGRLILDQDGILSAESTDAALLDALNKFASLTNNKPGLYIDAPSFSDDPQFSNASQFVTRGAPDFVDAIKEHADKYYGWKLYEIENPPRK